MEGLVKSKRVASLASADHGFAVEAYRRMVFIRAFEQKCLDLSFTKPPRIAGSVHLCAGQEAIPVGAAAAAGPNDKIVATYRGHGWALEAGLSPFSVLAEICHRAGGVNGGRAGSAYMMAPDQGFIGENSIVGAGVPIANGIALALGHQGDDGAVLVSFGDGAMNQGGLHEGLVFAAARDLPVVFVCENNGWSEMTATSKIVKIERLSRRASGYGMPGATIDGTDPVAVRDTIALALERARQGEGPSLIECNTIRLWGHYNRDIEHYRPKADRADAMERDPIAVMRGRLLEAGASDALALDAIAEEAEKEIAALAEAVLESALPDPATAFHPVVALAETEVPPFWDNLPADADITYQQAVNEALRAELAARPEVVLFGEDVGHAGGIFGISRNLQREFGEDRVFDTPIAESAILGAAVGAALQGLRPVAEIMWMDFLMVALDQLVNQAANVRYVTGGTAHVPMVMRVQQGATPGSCAQHSQSLEALLAHIPGLKVGLPSSPEDAYDMTRAAIADPDPCILIEARALYPVKGTVKGERLPVGAPRLRRSGGDLAILCWGTAVDLALEAAEGLAEEGVEAAVLDLRWIAPLDTAPIIDLVNASGGRALIVHEANLTGGFGAEIVARLHKAGVTAIDRVGAPDIRVPAAPVLQAALMPNADRIAAQARALLEKG